MWSSISHPYSFKTCQEDKSFKRKSGFAVVDWEDENSVIINLTPEYELCKKYY